MEFDLLMLTVMKEYCKKIYDTTAARNRTSTRTRTRTKVENF